MLISKWNWVLITREKLQGILYRFEDPGITDTHDLLFFFCGDDGILGSGGLMDVIDPGIDTPAFLNSSFRMADRMS